jgi:chemotaxis protein MotB
MSKRTFFLVLVLTAAVAAGSGCVPFWVHHDAIKKNENYLTIIEGHQKEHADLARKTDEAVSRATFLEIDNERLTKLEEELRLRLKAGSEKLQELLKEGVKQVEVDLGAEIAGGDVTITPDNKISIAGDVLFALGSADLTAKAKDILKKLAPVLKTKFKDYFIRVEGHTDDVPIKNPKTLEKYKTNWHLSMGRAMSVLMELKNLGIPEIKMYAAGYGEFSPRVPNAPGKKGAKKNRRVEIAIVEFK